MTSLENIFKEIKIPIFIPSTQKTEHFVPLSTAQLFSLQKIAHQITDTLDPLFYKETLHFIEQNKPTDLDLSSLNYWDFEYIAWAFYNTIYFPESKLPEIIIPSPIWFNYKDNLSIQVNIPTIDRYLKIEHWLFENIHNTQPNLVALVEVYLTESILLEFAKYIKTIKIGDTMIDLVDVSLEKTLPLIQSLPAGLFETTLHQIKQWQAQLQAIFPRHYGPWVFNKS